MASNIEIHIGMLEARNRFAELVRRVSGGATVTVTRHGQAVARLVSAKPEVDQAELARLIEDVRQLRATAGFTTNWQESKAARDEGRRF